MTAYGEKVLMQHLVDPDSLTCLAREGLPLEVIPTEALRPVFQWAMDYFFRSGMTKAPSVAALRGEVPDGEVGITNFGDLLSDHEIDLEHEPEDSIEFAIDDLKATYIHATTMRLNKSLATEMASANGAEKLNVWNEFVTGAVALSLRLENRQSAVDLRTGLGDTMANYDARATNRDQIVGMRFGLPAIDNHTHGIHDGEIAIVGSGPKVGKSYFLAHTALMGWRLGRPTVLFSLEMSVRDTIDRIACLAVAVDSRRWQRGVCEPDEVERVRDWIAEMERSDVPLWVVQPDLGQRTVEAMIRSAQVRGAQSVLIDQLSFVELPSPNRPRNERIGDALHTMQGMISTSRDPISCLIAAQMKREGVAAADKVGYHRMHDFGDSAEIERTAAWAFAIYASKDDKASGRCKFQTLAARREETKSWSMIWNLGIGHIQVIREEHLGG